jgi:hypothetical protein
LNKYRNRQLPDGSIDTDEDPPGIGIYIFTDDGFSSAQVEELAWFYSRLLPKLIGGSMTKHACLRCGLEPSCSQGSWADRHHLELSCDCGEVRRKAFPIDNLLSMWAVCGLEFLQRARAVRAVASR